MKATDQLRPARPNHRIHVCKLNETITIRGGTVEIVNVKDDEFKLKITTITTKSKKSNED